MNKLIVDEIVSRCDNLHHFEFNSRKYSIRTALKIVNKVLRHEKFTGRYQILDVVPGNVSDKIHLIIVKDCFECVYCDNKIVGMNVYDRDNITDDKNVCGITIVKFKTVNYFSEDLRLMAEKRQYVVSRSIPYSIEKKESQKKGLRLSGGMESPRDESDKIYEEVLKK